MALQRKTWFQAIMILAALLMSECSWLRGRKNKQMHSRHKYEEVNLSEKKRIKWYIDYDNLKPPECKDAKGLKHVCKSWRDIGLCEDEYDKAVMQIYCPKTCLICKAPAPIPCMSSGFGCCWDWQTKALSPYGDGCPDCKDRYRHFCPRFLSYCEKPGKNGKFVRYNCPRTCGFCRHDQLVITALEYKL